MSQVRTHSQHSNSGLNTENSLLLDPMVAEDINEVLLVVHVHNLYSEESKQSDSDRLNMCSLKIVQYYHWFNWRSVDNQKLYCNHKITQ